MRKVFVVVAALLTVFAADTLKAGDVPNVITTQGVLRNAGGDVVNGIYSLTLKMYTAQIDGQLLWSEVQNNVVVENGIYTSTLGTISPLPTSLFKQQTDVWLGVSVEGQKELPRVRITTVAYAFQSRSALVAETAEDLDCTGCIDEEMLGFDPVTEDKVVQVVKDSGQFLEKTGGVVSGGLEVSGLVTAAMFVGDGSGLTGISSPQGNCADGWFLTGIEADGTLVCKEAGSAITSIDGLSGGTINGDVEIGGVLTVNGAEACTLDGNCGETLAQLACEANMVAMWSGDTWICSNFVKDVPDAACEGENNVLTWDGETFACKEITGTGPSAGAAQGFELEDPWGYTWDGMMRPIATWSEADKKCKELGGRLPSGTEIYRVSQVGGSPGGAKLFGPMGTGDWLWSGIQYAAAHHTMGKMNDGDINYSGDSSKRHYRCVWPNNYKKYFTGNHCYGPADAECFALATEGKRYYMDNYDRPRMYYSAAVSECNFYHAHVADSGRYTQAIKSGLSNGTNNWQWTSDQVNHSENYQYYYCLRWSGVKTDFDGSWQSSYANSHCHVTSEYWFRCLGVNYVAEKSPVNVANRYDSDTTYLTSTTNDMPKKRWHEAIDHCWSLGGHLSGGLDMYELGKSGLPGGTNEWLWTTDQVGNWSSHWRVLLTRWNGTDKGMDPSGGTYTTHDGMHYDYSKYFRCTWYPVDTEYTGPQPGACTGGCQEFVLANTNPPVKIWADKQDRPSTNWAGANQICYLAGGHLASQRDMTEIIRKGLENGTNSWQWTSEVHRVHNDVLIGQVRWSGTNPNYGDYKNGYNNITWTSNTPSHNYHFRCVWTNELR